MRPSKKPSLSCPSKKPSFSDKAIVIGFGLFLTFVVSSFIFILPIEREKAQLAAKEECLQLKQDSESKPNFFLTERQKSICDGQGVFIYYKEYIYDVRF